MTTDLSSEKFTEKEGATTPHCLSVSDCQMGKRCSCCGEIARPTSVWPRREVARLQINRRDRYSGLGRLKESISLGKKIAVYGNANNLDGSSFSLIRAIFLKSINRDGARFMDRSL